jgi:hypothetical protein
MFLPQYVNNAYLCQLVLIFASGCFSSTIMVYIFLTHLHNTEKQTVDGIPCYCVQA